jgi:cytochrome c oxidase subunit 1
MVEAAATAIGGRRRRTPPGNFFTKHVFSTDHKTVGKQYFFLALFAVLIGMMLSWLMRIHLAWPNLTIPLLGKFSPKGAPGGAITPEYYLSLMTMHATLMAFFVLTTAPASGFGTYFLPIQIGSEEMAFPKLSLLSFWLTFTALMVLLSAFFVPDGPPISGWTAYPPLSAVGGDAGPGEALGQTLWALAIAIFCVAQILSAVNIITTVLDMRTEGMTLGRMPLSVWGWFVTAMLSLTSFCVLLPAGLLLLLDRLAGTSFFLPAELLVSGQIEPHAGGSPLLWQHLFWFFGHPEVYIAILPSFGIISQVFPVFTRKPLLGSRIMIGCMISIALLSSMVWGHHMFVSGMNPFSALVFSLPTLIITIPSIIAGLLWIGTIYGAQLRFPTMALFALGFISVFISGGLGGFFLAQPSLDTYLHATYFVVGHFHLVMAVAAVFGIFAGTYFWFPKMFGRMMNEALGKTHFWLTFAGVYCTFMPMYLLGFAGNVRRYPEFTDDYLIPLIPLHRFITVAALVTGAAQFLFLFNLVWSYFRGEKAADNPWEATTLEWTIPSPPPFNSFGGQPVVVGCGPEEYGRPGRNCDYVAQNSSPEQLAAD